VGAGRVRVEGPVRLGEPAPELVGGGTHIGLGRQGVLGVRVQLVDAGRKGIPRRRGCLGPRFGRRKDARLLLNDDCPAPLLVIDRDRIDMKIAGQLVKDGQGLSPLLSGRALDAQRQEVIAAARKLVPGGLRPCGPVPAPDLSDIPAQAQSTDYFERIIGRRHIPSLYGA